jgi:uncharacterized membrane protein
VNGETTRTLTIAAYWISVTTLLALIALSLAWELWLAPLRPGGSWLVLKVLPLLAPLRGILRGSRYTAQWSSLLILAFFAEGIVRAWTEPPPATWLALCEIALSLGFFVAVVCYARFTRHEPGRDGAGP